MKKKVFMLLSMLLFAGSFFLISQFQQNNFAVFNRIDHQMVKFIKKSHRRTTELGFTALLCNGIRVPFDEETNTFFVPLDREEEAWEKLEFTSGQPEYQVLFSEDVTNREKQEMIASGEDFSLVVFDEQHWGAYSVVFTGLPIIDLSTNEGFYAEEEITGSAVFYDTDFAQHGTQQSEYAGHIRGNTSRMFPKKGYKINLITTDKNGEIQKNKLSLFDMRKDDDWILYAMYNDESKLRDRLSMAVWDTFGAGAVSEKSYYGPKMTYVEVFADNRYCGLYGLMEPVDAKQLDLNEEDYSYKRKNPGSLKYHYSDFHDSKNPEAEVEGFEMKSGSVEEDADLWMPLADLAALLTLSNEEFLEQESRLINEESALNLWLFIQMITGFDQITKNVFYVAQYREDYKYDYEFYFAPWDMDLTWGNVSVGEVNPLYTDFEWETFDEIVPWDVGSKLLETDYHDARTYVKELYKKLRKTVLTDEALEEMIQTFDTELRASGAFERDRERWPEGAHAENQQLILSYAKERMAFLDKALYNDSYYED